MSYPALRALLASGTLEPTAAEDITFLLGRVARLEVVYEDAAALVAAAKTGATFGPKAAKPYLRLVKSVGGK